MNIEDDNRTFWAFEAPCGCAVGVVTDHSYGRTKAFREMFGGVKPANAAIDRGITATHMDAKTYRGEWSKKMTASPCTHGPAS
jgi:hypothetical protein